jgi:2-polyprenyl-6-hydroxyphenyl methylase/3-demethylubiquinone-9 3-methyltransferase
VTLSLATIKQRPVRLSGEPPFPATALAPLVGKRFLLPAADPFVLGTGDPEHGYLDGARAGWAEHPEYMDFLAPSSPVFALKRLERDLYLHHWAPFLVGEAFLDVGAGIGRFTLPLLARGATVHAVDVDLESLRRLVWHAAGGQGRLDVYWTSVGQLPPVVVDVAVCAEVLCYVPDTLGALRAVAERVRPGGTVLLSVEARYGWAAAQDAPPAIEAALGGDGVIWIPGDRWVRTFEREQVEGLLAEAGLEPVSVVPSHWIPDGPLEHCGPPEVTLEQILALEERCRAHPVWGPLNRLWLAAARKP